MIGNIFDSHAHYDAKQFDADRDALLAVLPSKGVCGVITVADSLDSARRCRTIASQYDYIYSSAGVHPHEAVHAAGSLEADLTDLLADPKCRALGEIGLDYHYDFSPRDRQRDIFGRQLALAGDLNKPVIIHDRDAHADTLAFLNKYRPRGVVHCYSGSAEMAETLLALGLYISFTGVVTFKNARRALEALAVIPLERLLVETDSPYMAPEPLRGKRCDSSMIPHTAGVMARIKGVSVQELLDAARDNACRLFDINLTK